MRRSKSPSVIPPQLSERRTSSCHPPLSAALSKSAAAAAVRVLSRVDDVNVARAEPGGRQCCAINSARALAVGGFAEIIGVIGGIDNVGGRRSERRGAAVHAAAAGDADGGLRENDEVKLF